MKRLSLVFGLAIYAIAGYSGIWTLSDDHLAVHYDDQTLVLTIRDKRCDKTWRQNPLKETFALKHISQEGNTLNLGFSGEFPYYVSISLTAGSDVEISVSADSGTFMEELGFPFAFQTPDSDHYLLLTDGEGLLLPVDDEGYPSGIKHMYTMAGGLCMPWLGITDNRFQTGYISILDTPDDAAYRIKRDSGLITFEPVWLSTRGKFGYSRKVIYHFFHRGGYVAQCKKYRDYVWEKKHAESLREKQNRFPAIEKMVGAIHIYVWDEAREVSFAKQLRESGISKAFILWDPNHNPYPVAGYDDSLKNLGYASGVQDLWRDIHPHDSLKESPGNSSDPTFLRRPHFPGMYPEITVKKKDGTIDRSSFGSHVCPGAVLPIIPAHRADKEYSLYPHEGWFVDVYHSKKLYECYNEDHPLTRTQYKETVSGIFKLFSQRYNVYTGGEWGADFGIPYLAFAHGMMTLHRTWFGSDAYKRGTIYFVGAWSDKRPSIMIGTSTATDAYLQYSINEFTRVPLYQLVYHDAIVTTWRWEDSNHKMPEIWWKKDLFNILYGTPPLWSIDQELWRKYRITFMESYHNISPWIQEIGYEEMVSHRFVTRDHKVQESLFSSGQRAVVNFGDSDYSFEGKTIQGKSFILL